MRINRFKQTALLAAVVATLGLAAQSQAATLTWSSTASGGWQDPGAWSGADWADGSDAEFNESDTTSTITVTLNAPVVANSLTWTSGRVSIASSDPTTNTLSLGAGGLTANGKLAGTSISAPLNLTASQTWINNVGSYVVVSGLTNFGDSSQTLTLTRTSDSGNGNFQFSNSNNTGSATIVVVGTSTSGSCLQAGADNPFGSGLISLQNNARLSSGSTAARAISNNISLDGNANVGGQSNVGALTLNGTFTVNGDYSLTSDAGGSASKSQTVTFAGNTILKGNLALTTKSYNTTIFTGSIGDDGTPRSLTKNGAGSVALLQLAGHNTYTGSTNINAGTLQLDGGSLANSNINIASGANFSATANGGTLIYNLLDDTADEIVNGGTLDITNLNLVANISGVQTGAEYVIADNTAGALTGSSFASATLPAGWSINYGGTAAHPSSIVLVAPVPEPASIGLLAIGGLACLTRRRRRA